MGFKISRLAVIILIILLLAGKSFAAKAIDHSKSAWDEWAKDGSAEQISWLSLAGLYWLNPGMNTIGSAPSNDHVLPKELPATMGRIEVIGSSVIYHPVDNSISIQLVADSASKVLFKNYSLSIINRESTFALRLQDMKNPAIRNFKGRHFFNWQDSMVIDAKFIPENKPNQLMIQTVYGTLRPMAAVGWVEFSIDGKTYRLHAVDGGKDQPMFIMFKDKTSEYSTYGSGRYLYVDKADANGNLLIDFNRAHNPPCAITEFATCPLPPPSNRLPIEIRAGEQYSIQD